MVNSEYERRIAARFATFDQDGNGYIDRTDFGAAAKALLAEFGTAPGPTRGRRSTRAPRHSGRAWPESPTGTATSASPGRNS